MNALTSNVLTPNPLTAHGGRIDAATLRFPHAPRPWIDLSTGINPFAWDGDVPSIDWRALPSVSALSDLEAVAAAAFGAPIVAALPGTEIGLRLLSRLGLPAPLRYVAPSYATHAAALGGTAIRIADLATEAGRGGTILLASPNNPDGHVVPVAELLETVRHLRERGGWLVVDEAFADVDPACSIQPHLAADDPVIVFRSFGKFFGLAGVRLGFVGAPDAMLAHVRAMLGSWPVSAAAIAIGTAAYRDTDWGGQTRATLVETAARLDALLARHGLAARGACPLFRLVETDARTLFRHLAHAGILTRPFDHDARWLRIGLPGDEIAWDRLDVALRHG